MKEGKIILFVGVLFSLVSLREGRRVSEIKIKTSCIPFSGETTWDIRHSHMYSHAQDAIFARLRPR